MSGSSLLDLLADGTHARSRVRFLSVPGADATPLSGVWSASERAAGWIADRFGRSPVVATTLEASEAGLACLIGTWRAGGRLVSIPSRARGQSVEAHRQQVAHACAVTGAQVLLVGDPSDEALQELDLPVHSTDELASGPRLVELRDGGELVQFSSGTTASPKGIVLGLDAIAANVGAILDRLDLPGPGVSCSWLPLSHDMGLIGMCLVPWAAFGPRWQSAGEMVLIPTSSFVRNPSIWMRACSDHRATVTTAPTFAYDLVGRRLNPARALDLSSLQACIVGSEPVLPEALRRFALAGEPFGLDPTSLCPAYGLAESALAVTLHPPGEPWRTARLAGPGADDGPELVRCGPAVGDMAVRVAPADAGVGEIEISGSSLFDGYLRADGEIDPPGAWFETRDLGAEVDGELVVTGRVDDLLFVGGAKISAVEVEQAALRAPGVRPDGAAAVQVGTMAFVVVVERRSGGQARTGANDLGHAVRSEVTAALGRGPAEVVVLPPGSLPRTPSGKIQRHRVRALHDGGELEPDARVRFQARREER